MLCMQQLAYLPFLNPKKSQNSTKINQMSKILLTKTTPSSIFLRQSLFYSRQSFLNQISLNKCSKILNPIMVFGWKNQNIFHLFRQKKLKFRGRLYSNRLITYTNMINTLLITRFNSRDMKLFWAWTLIWRLICNKNIIRVLMLLWIIY